MLEESHSAHLPRSTVGSVGDRFGKVGSILAGRTRGASAQYPQYAVEDIPRISLGSATTVGSASRIEDQRFEHFPLFVGQIHAPPRLDQLNAQPFSVLLVLCDLASWKDYGRMVSR